MSKLNATETLRQLLDERGVKYKYRDMFGKHVFHWGTPAVNGAMFTDGGKWTELVVENPTPEQAVEATLGKGICKVEQHGSLANWPDMVCWSCSECGFGWHHSINDKQFTYCPNCGRKIES